jgi:glycosyltransferase involved in cell wall biosynthesis
MTAKPALVSVVMPTFNRLKHLRSAVASVFAQTVPDWELLIADDGSDTETRAYLRSLSEAPRVRILWRSHCGVPAVVRNAALAEASGKYVAFLDSDDEWMPQKLQRQLTALRARPERHWSYTGYVLIDDAGNPKPRAAYQELARPEGSILAALLANAVDIWTPAVMVERTLLVRLGGFNPRLVVFEDYDLWLRLATQSEIELVDEPLIAVRRHADQFCREDRRFSMAQSRDQALRAVQALVSDPRLRRLVGRERARSALDLARAQAAIDRAGAMGSILRGGQGAWRYPAWWTGLPRTLLRLALPRSLLELYARVRPRA